MSSIQANIVVKEISEETTMDYLTRLDLEGGLEREIDFGTIEVFRIDTKERTQIIIKSALHPESILVEVV